MATLFETTTINTMTLGNRFVRSATWEGMAGDDGSVTHSCSWEASAPTGWRRDSWKMV